MAKWVCLVIICIQYAYNTSFSRAIPFLVYLYISRSVLHILLLLIERSVWFLQSNFVDNFAKREHFLSLKIMKQYEIINFQQERITIFMEQLIPTRTSTSSFIPYSWENILYIWHMHHLSHNHVVPTKYGIHMFVREIMHISNVWDN